MFAMIMKSLVVIAQNVKPAKNVTKTMNYLSDLIKSLSDAPEDQMDLNLSKECSEYLADEHTEEEDVIFLRNVLDSCVIGSSGSGFVVSAISALISVFPETEEEAKKRRLAKFGGYARAMYKE